MVYNILPSLLQRCPDADLIPVILAPTQVGHIIKQIVNKHTLLHKAALRLVRLIIRICEPS